MKIMLKLYFEIDRSIQILSHRDNISMISLFFSKILSKDHLSKSLIQKFYISISLNNNIKRRDTMKRSIKSNISRY